MTSKHYLPSKVNSYLRRLLLEYGESGRTNLSEIINSARINIIEETSYDNWNGGTYGHDVQFFLPEIVLAKIKVREQGAISEEIRNDLNACAEAIENEFFRKVFFEANDEQDSEYQKSVGLSQRPPINPDSLSIWVPNQIRLFISHRDNHKSTAKELARKLSGYGISAFVAHDSIEPMTTWQQEILKGLETMEIMVAFVTDDFHDSTWTNQEVGYALGRNIPVVSLKLENADPSGFIGSFQALKGRLDAIPSVVQDIYNILAEKLGNKKRLQSALVSTFVESSDYNEAKERFDRLKTVVKTLTEEDVEKIIFGFRENKQLHNCIYLNNSYHRLKNYLEQCTGKVFIFDKKDISLQKPPLDDEIPF